MFKLLGGEKLIVGIDISDEYTQISYCGQEEPEAPETLSITAGADNFNIPTVLCKKEGSNQWFFGRDALRAHEQENGILIDNLVSLAANGESVYVEETLIEPVSLLTLFLKRCLGLLYQVQPTDRIGGIVFTCSDPDHNMKDILSRAAAGLKLKTDRIYVQGYDESFYYFMIHQPKELWSTGALLMDFCDDGTGSVVAYHLKCNRHATPVVVHINETKYPFAAYTPAASGDNIPAVLAGMDREFLNICKDCCQDRQATGIYLIGEEFTSEWMKESLKYLCTGRRVFQGNNLYSKGACYSMLERISQSDTGREYVFMGNNKLKANIGMKMWRMGEESCYAVLSAGNNWYEAEKTFDFYIQDGNSVEIYISSLVGKGNKLAQIILEELPEGPCRLNAVFKMRDATHLTVEIEDLGLGAMRAATHHVWKEEIEV
jgi:hypothetical protein